MSTETATIDEFPGYTFYRDGRATNKYGQFIGSIDKSEGYVITSFTDKNGKRHKKRLHIMIMWAFSGEPQNGRDVDHINGKRDDNRFENLQYLDRKNHNSKTRKDNPGMLKKIQYPVQGIKENGETIKFNCIKDAVAYLSELESYSKIKNIEKSISDSITRKGIFNKEYRWSYINDDIIENEIWRKPNIEGIDPNIEVSNMGRLKRRNGVIINKFNINNGYQHTSVQINNKSRTKKLHTLICSAFHGKQPDWASSVNHKDGNPLNNKSDNLEWSDHMKQADSWRSKIHLEKDGKIEHTFNSIKETAEFLKVSGSGIKNCLSGKNKTIKGYTVIRDSNSKEIKKRVRGQRTKNGGTAIEQLDDDKNIIKEFPTIQSAVNELFPNLDISKLSSKTTSIRFAMICGYKLFNYYWKFKNPPENIDELREKERLRCIEKCRKKRMSKKEI